MTQPQKFNLELNPERMENLYYGLRATLQAHLRYAEGKEASLLYEAIDSLALVTSEVWASLHNNVSDNAGKEARKYFKERCAIYMNNLRKDKQAEMNLIRRSRRIIRQ